MGMSRSLKVGLAAAWLVAAGAAASGCSSTVDGVASCPGCGSGTEPDFSTPRTSPTMPTPMPLPPAGSGDLQPSETGYVYIETKSGKTRCQISSDKVACESEFTATPTVEGQPANGLEVTADGTNRWTLGNLGAIPTTSIDYASYHALGWTIEADADGTRFTNDETGHGMFVNTEGADFF